MGEERVLFHKLEKTRDSLTVLNKLYNVYAVSVTSSFHIIKEITAIQSL